MSVISWMKRMSLLIAAVSILPACQAVHMTQNGGASPAGSVAGTEALRGTEALPRSVAGPAETLNIPRRIPRLVTIRCTTSGETVHVFSSGNWSGHVVTLYYLPVQNLLVDRGHYDLKSARNVQRIGRSVVRANGTWKWTWKAKGVFRGRVDPLFVLAMSDTGQLAYARVPLRRLT